MRRNSTSPETAEVFISYRRDDSAGHAGRLFDHLARLFPGRVFMDTDALELGDDFPAKIQQAIASCRVLIAVIGREWLTMTDAAGRRRLDDPRDVLSRELAMALGRDDAEVIPVLVQKTEMPTENLPANLAMLSGKNAIKLRDDRRWTHEVEPLIERIETVLGEARYRTPRWRDVVRKVAGPGTAVFVGMLARLPLFGIPSLIPFQLRDLLVPCSAVVMGLSAAGVEFYGAGHISRSAVRRRFAHALMATLVGLGLVWFVDLRDELTLTVDAPHSVTVLVGPDPRPRREGCPCTPDLTDKLCIREFLNDETIAQCWGPLEEERRRFWAAFLTLSVGVGGFVGLISRQLKAKREAMEAGSSLQ